MYYAEISAGKVSALLQTDTDMQYPHVEIDSYDTTLLFSEYDEQSGEFIRAPAPTHKTSGIDLIEWSKLFTISEMMVIDRLSANIEGDLSFLPNGTVDIDDSTLAILGFAGTYRDFLRTCFKRFAECATTGINVADPLILPSLYCFELLGIIATGRKEVIVQGVPL